MRIGKLLLFLIVGVLSSCDYFIAQEGWVVESQTSEPLNQVQVELLIDNQDDRTLLGYEYDSLSIVSRDSLNKVMGISKPWEEQGWYVSVPSIQTGKYARHIPLKTDTAGYFDVFLHTGYFSTYSLKFTKEGYIDKVMTDAELDKLNVPLVVNLEKRKTLHKRNK